MKKVMLIGMFAVAAMGLLAADRFVSVVTTIPEGVSTNVVVDVPLFNNTAPFYAVDEFSFKNGSTGVVSVTLYTVNMEVETAIATLASIPAGGSLNTFPLREYLTGATTNYVPYNVRNARIKYTNTGRAAAVTNWYQIKAK